ncbi:sugar phosphate isomerase/epimerase [Candidatus Woesearchaeota archaeon]|nr:sugar phosphate isomerase/epimerase [Candidatus Woesearchaeota archaeon]
MGEEKKVAFNAEEAFKRQTFDGRKLENRVHLFTGQFQDLWQSPNEMAAAVRALGYDGIGDCTWGPTGIDVVKAVGNDGVEYLGGYIRALRANNIGVSTLGDHLASQAIASKVFTKGLVAILPPDVRRGHSEADILHNPAIQEEIKLYAALHVMNTARALERFREVAKNVVGSELQGQRYNPTVVAGFTGSPIWHLLAGFPPVSIEEEVQMGYEEVAYRMARVLDVMKNTGNRFGLETHPGEIAYDLSSAIETNKKINRPEFGFNGDSSHSVGRGWNYLLYLTEIAKLGKLFSTHLKGAAEGTGDGSASVYNRLDHPFGDKNPFWDFKSIGRGTQDEGGVIYKLGEVGFKGAFEVEWEDAQLDKIAGAKASQLIVRGFVTGNEGLIKQGLRMYENPTNYKRAEFDAAFQRK